MGGVLAGCSDMDKLCANHPDSFLIRHKCPMTCGVCGNVQKSTTVEVPGTNGDLGGCDRRRRWGFCSTRRRRQI
jgi:hypothetical protein